jgi:Holliday junction resolvase RusA-like endonuclease
MTLGDLPPKYLAEVERALGGGKPLGVARSQAIRAIEVVPPVGSAPVYQFSALGEPKGQPRPRAFAMRTAGGKYSARVFDAGTAEGWKSIVAEASRSACPPEPISGPVRVGMTFGFRRPKSHLKSNGETKGGAPNRHTSKPDADNLAKAVLDCLTQTGLWWHDDAQVAELRVLKEYAPRPCVVVTVQPLEAI